MKTFSSCIFLLQNHPFYKRYENETDNQDVAAWIRQVSPVESDVSPDNKPHRSGT